jgi:hypothetical protein
VNIPIRTAKPKFLSEAMLNAAREHATHLEQEEGQTGTPVMINLLVADIEAYREAFKGAAITLNHAGAMLKRNDGEIRETSRSLALIQLKLSVLFDAAKDAFDFLNGQIADYRVADGIEGAAALHAVADGLRAPLELAGAP